jgi:hypothetical protein
VKRSKADTFLKKSIQKTFDSVRGRARAGVSHSRFREWLTPALARPRTESKVFARFFQKALLAFV